MANRLRELARTRVGRVARSMCSRLLGLSLLKCGRRNLLSDSRVSAFARLPWHQFTNSWLSARAYAAACQRGNSQRAPSASADPVRPAARPVRIVSKSLASTSAYNSQTARAPRTQPSSPFRWASSPRVPIQNVSGVTCHHLQQSTVNFRNLLVLVMVGPFVTTACAIVQLWDRAVSWSDVALLVGLYIPISIGVTAGLHRMLTHRSFRAHPLVRAALLVLARWPSEDRQ